MGYRRLRTVIWYSAISAGMVRGRESCCTGAGATFEVISQNREKSRVRQRGYRGKVKKIRVEYRPICPSATGGGQEAIVLYRICRFLACFLLKGMLRPGNVRANGRRCDFSDGPSRLMVDVSLAGGEL